MRRPDGLPSRRALAYSLAAGLALSAGAALAFYTLYAAPGGYRSAAHYDYSLGYDLGLFGATMFGIGLIFAVSLRLVAAFSFVALNLLFAWSTRVLSMVTRPFDSDINWLSSPKNGLIWDGAAHSDFTRYLRTAAGLEGLLLLGVLVASIALLNRGKRTWRALLSASQAGSLCLVVLGAQVAAFDRQELYLHVSNLQVFIGFIPWFDNADLLVTALSVLVASSALLRLQWPGRAGWMGRTADQDCGEDPVHPARVSTCAREESARQPAIQQAP